MPLLHHTSARIRRPVALARGAVVAALLSATGLSAQAKPAPVKTVRIRNASTIQVVIGRKSEPAANARPDKDGWKLVVGPELEGAIADLQDATPNARSNKQSVTVTDGALLLDTQRFLPTHVYRITFVKERQIVGSAVVYLRAPPAGSRNSKVDFTDGQKADEGPAGDDGSAPISPTPKGKL